MKPLFTIVFLLFVFHAGAQQNIVVSNVPKAIRYKKVKRVRQIQMKIREGQSHARISIQLWDRGVKDGDIVSIKHNNDFVLHHFTTKKCKNNLSLKLERGEHQLRFIADNEGKYGPNTAWFKVRRGWWSRKFGISCKEGYAEMLIIKVI